jgi:hypothetical protein
MPWGTAMASCCRRYRARRLKALGHDPQLLVIRPAPPATSLDHLKPFKLSTALMAVHKDCYAPIGLIQQGGPRRRETGVPYRIPKKARTRRELNGKRSPTQSTLCERNRAAADVRAWSEISLQMMGVEWTARGEQPVGTAHPRGGSHRPFTIGAAPNRVACDQPRTFQSGLGGGGTPPEPGTPSVALTVRKFAVPPGG